MYINAIKIIIFFLNRSYVKNVIRTKIICFQNKIFIEINFLFNFYLSNWNEPLFTLYFQKIPLIQSTPSYKNQFNQMKLKGAYQYNLNVMFISICILKNDAFILLHL